MSDSQPPEHFDTIVIGTGGVGSSALYHLASRGQRALGLDQHPPGHRFGSSHGETRVIRQAYFEHPDYVPLLLRAYELWRELEEQTDEQLLVQTGLLQIGQPDGVVLKGVLAAAEEHRLSVQSLTQTQVHERYPQFQLAPGEVGVFESTAGYLLVEKCVKAHLSAATAAGAKWQQQHVTDWSHHGGKFHVETTSTSFTADRLIVSAGPWVSDVVKEFRHTHLLRKHQHWFALPSASANTYRCPSFPIFLAETADGIFYGFPTLDETSLKVAEHGGGTPIDAPISEKSGPDTEDRSRVATFVRSYLPEFSGDTVRHEPCYYTMTSDEHFLVGALPDQHGLLIAAGLSGHGFKFTSVLGQVLADLAIDGSTQLPIDFLSPSRVV